MNLKLARELASRFLALAGCMSVVLTGEISPLLSVAALAGVALSLFQVVQGQGPWLSLKTWNVLNLIVLIYFVTDFFILSQSLLVAITHFTLLLMLNKLFNLKTPQDHFQLFLISLLQLLAASTFTIDITFVVAFVFFLLAAIWALLLHHLVVQAQVHRKPLPSHGLTMPFFITTNILALAVLGTSLVFFLILPRIGAGFLQKGRSDLIKVSGFSEEVNLGDIGPIKLDSTVVMRAQLRWEGESVDRPPIYWRGMVFDYYNGRSWRNSFGKGTTLPRNVGSRFKVRPYRSGLPILSQEIMLEPLETSVLFAVSQPAELTGRFGAVWANRSHALNLLYAPSTRLHYTAYSQIPMFQTADLLLQSIDPPSRIKDYYLQLPSDSDRIAQLAQEVTQPARTIYEKVRLVERFLKKNYRYSLDIDPVPGENPIEHFLFRQKKGYCEQYATAMTLLLRAVGIPSRLVTGFLQGELNEYGDYYTVRNSDAHAWIEVWFPVSGWLPFDPTPTAPGGASSIWAGWIQYLDSLHWKWNRYIVSYSLYDQVAVVKEVRAQGFRLRETLHNGWDAIRRGVLEGLPSFHRLNGVWILAALVLILMITSLVIRQFQKRRLGIRWRFIRSINPSTVKFYERLLSTLNAHGLAKPAAVTPLEFCRKLERDGMDPHVTDLTVLYYRVRFGKMGLTPEETCWVEEILYRLQRPPAASRI